MNESLLGRFFGVVARPRTWTNLLFNMLAFPLGLFYFVFFVTGLSVGLGLVIIWVGIPILLLVVGAWWLFAAFERLQAEYLLGADVAGSPRPWEAAEGIWGKVKAHFGSASTWKDLLYLLAKLAFGTVSFTVMVTLAAVEAWFVLLPVAAIWNVRMFTFGDGHVWTPPLWLGLLGIPCAILWIFVSLHILNGWSWICARWAEVLLRSGPPPVPAAFTQPVPLVSTSPQPPMAPLVSTSPQPTAVAQPPQPPAVPAPSQPPVAAASPAPLTTPAPLTAPAPDPAPAALPETSPQAQPETSPEAQPDAQGQTPDSSSD